MQKLGRVDNRECGRRVNRFLECCERSSRKNHAVDALLAYDTPVTEPAAYHLCGHHSSPPDREAPRKQASLTEQPTS